MDVMSRHTRQFEPDSLYELKQEAFFRILDQVNDLHADDSIAPALKNISLYLGKDESSTYSETEFAGIYRSTSASVSIKEYFKYDDSNWIVFVHVGTIPETNGDAVVDLNIENPFASITEFAIGMADGVNIIAPRGSERVISMQSDLLTKYIKVSFSKLNAHMAEKQPTNGYKVDQFNDGVYLLDSPAPLFGKDTVEYRDSDYVGLWISFGTLLKFDLTNLNVFNIDGVKVGAVDINTKAKDINILKMATNVAYGYATILFSKEELLRQLMLFSKKYVYQTNMQDETRICVDNILETLQEKGVLGLLYEDFDVIESYPMIAYDEHEVRVIRHLGNALRFKYKNEYIYMVLDLQANKMYFMSYAGRILTYNNEKYGYNIKVKPDMMLSKVNDITPERFVLFTGFPNLQHNKVLDFYFDNTQESFSSLDKSFAIDVKEFDGFYEEHIQQPSEYSYRKRTDLIESYGNNLMPLATGMLSYRFLERRKYTNYYALDAQSEPVFGTLIDVEDKVLYMMHPMLATQALDMKSLSPVRIREFLQNYFARYLQTGTEDTTKWVEEVEYGGYMYSFVAAFYSNGWYIVKDSSDKYKVLQTTPTKIQYRYEGDIAPLCLSKAKEIMQQVEVMIENGETSNRVNEFIRDEIANKENEISAELSARIRQIESGYYSRIMTKSTRSAYVVNPDSPRFEFNKFEGSDDIYVNNPPTGEVCNHALLYEDTLSTIFQQYRDVLAERFGLSLMSGIAVSPFIRSMNVRDVGGRLYIDVKSDVAASVPIVYSRELGLKSAFEMFGKKGVIEVGGQTFVPEDAYDVFADAVYLGEKDIDGETLSNFRVLLSLKMSKELENAYENGFINARKEMASQFGVDYDEIKQKAIEKYADTDSFGTLELPKIPAATPVFVAYSDSKIMVSIDGITYFNAPVGTNGIELTNSMWISSKRAFISSLQAIVNAGKNHGEFVLEPTDEHDKEDLFTVGVDSITIDYSNFVEQSNVSVVCKMTVDNGDIVLADNLDILYKEGDSFVVEKTVDVDGFTRIDDDTVCILVNIPVEYYVPVNKSDYQYSFAEELLNDETTYLAKLNIPVFASVKYGKYAFVDKQEAIDAGIVGWFDFEEDGEQ